MASAIEEIIKHLEAGENFLLSGGAGSGKTYSLIEVLKQIYEKAPLARVACITYTNVAVNEIKDRAPFDRLHVSTIHDFLWDSISSFKQNLKESLVHLISEDAIRYTGSNEITVEYYRDLVIEYREWRGIDKGIVSHDEVIILAEYMFSKFPLLSSIIKDKWEYILVDEYQDTFKPVVDILLKHLTSSRKKNVIGFFGDSMQSIFDTRVGSIKEYIESGVVKEIEKTDNRRSPQEIVDVINAIRDDGLKQQVASDTNAPNQGVKGSVVFLHSNSEEYDIDNIKSLDYFQEFDFTDSVENKELYLVHNLIATKAGFPTLMVIYDKERIIDFKNAVRKELKKKGIEIEHTKTFGEAINISGKKPTRVQQDFIDANPELFEKAKKYPYEIFRKIYVDKDQLIGDKKNQDDLKAKTGQRRDALTRHMFQIQECIFLYSNKRYNEFINKTHYVIRTVKDKKNLQESILKLASMGDSTIEEVIEYAHESNIWLKDDRFNAFVDEKEYIYDRVKEVKFKEVISLYNYIEDYTPFSTQHNIKGAQFDNVFVVLDNGKWNKYNFTYLFEETDGKETIIERTRKIFYVCCSRAKKNLVVFFHKPTESILEKAKLWFGEDNVYKI